MAGMQNSPRRLGYYGAYGNTSNVLTTLTEDMAHTFAQKYDVTNLSRNEYSLLLSALRNEDMITTQEFSAAYGGTLPHGAAPGTTTLHPLPLGDNKSDFTALLKQYVTCCTAFLQLSPAGTMEHNHVKSLLSTYSHLSSLFGQIQAAAPAGERGDVID